MHYYELFTATVSTIFDQKLRTTIYGNETTVCGRCINNLFVFESAKT